MLASSFPLASLVLAGIAGLLHVLFFVLESVRFSDPKVWRRFGVASQDHADAVRPMALNQGYYNLFLALGTFTGIAYAISARHTDIADAARSAHNADALLWFALLCMVGAALVLLISSRGRMARAALIQGGAPTAALLLAMVA